MLLVELKRRFTCKPAKIVALLSIKKKVSWDSKICRDFNTWNWGKWSVSKYSPLLDCFTEIFLLKSVLNYFQDSLDLEFLKIRSRKNKVFCIIAVWKKKMLFTGVEKFVWNSCLRCLNEMGYVCSDMPL